MEKAVRVLDLFCEYGLLKQALVERYPGRKIQYFGIDEEAPSSKSAGNLEEAYTRADIALEEPEKLRRQIRTAIGEGSVDEIHMHMPGKLVYSPGALEVLAEFLNPGGRIYHSFAGGAGVQWDSPTPLFKGSRHVPKFGTHVFPSNPSEFESNKELIAEQASRAGLKLDKYGLRDGFTWITRPQSVDAIDRAYTRLFTGHLTQSQGGSADEKTRGHYTEYNPAMFVILRKPKSGKATERPQGKRTIGERLGGLFSRKARK